LERPLPVKNVPPRTTTFYRAVFIARWLEISRFEYDFQASLPYPTKVGQNRFSEQWWYCREGFKN
jgi:hypothetical protein